MPLYIGLSPDNFPYGGSIADDKGSIAIYTQEAYPPNDNKKTPRKYSLEAIIDYVIRFVQGEIDTENPDVYEIDTTADLPLILNPKKASIAIIADGDGKGNKGLTFYNGVFWLTPLILYVLHELYYEQTVPSTEWVITHNFGKKPLVQVFVDNVLIQPQIEYPVVNEQNAVKVIHNTEQIGFVILKA